MNDNREQKNFVLKIYLPLKVFYLCVVLLILLGSKLKVYSSKINILDSHQTKAVFLWLVTNLPSFKPSVYEPSKKSSSLLRFFLIKPLQNIVFRLLCWN